MKHPKTFDLPVDPSSASGKDSNTSSSTPRELPDPSAMGSHRGPVTSSNSDSDSANNNVSNDAALTASSLKQKLMYTAGSRDPGRALKTFRAPSHKLLGDAYEDAFDDLVALNKRPQFIELLAQTNFSFLQGGSHPEEMVLRAKKLGYRGIGICDVNGLYGVVRGYQAAEKPSVFDAEQLAFADENGKPTTPFQYLCGATLTAYDSAPVTLLPMNKDGYVRLSHLITKAKRKAPKGQIILSLKDICDQNEDLIAFPLPPWKGENLKKLKEAFQDRLYLPVHKDFTWESVRAYRQALQFESELGLSLFATQRPLFHDPSRKPLHDVLTCILHKTTLREGATRLTLNRERYLKTPEQISFLFRERPDLVARTLEIASRINFSLTELRYRYPQENLPKGKTATEHLRDLCEKGLWWRYGEQITRAKHLPSGPEKQKEAAFLRKVRKQIDEELALIAKLEYEDYFLTLREICEFAKSKNILHQGRGSAANSVVCYTLGLTAVDPVKLGLLFGRFLSEERAEPPDIDIDFEHERREEVIQHIYSKYGERRAAMVCTVVCYRSRMAIREVAKVMGLELSQVDALVKFMGREGLSRLVDEQLRPHLPADEKEVELPEAHSPASQAESPDRGHSFDLQKIGLTPETFQKLLHLSLALQGFPRHLGIHSGGFVISNDAVIDIVPVESATMDSRFVVQWNKDDINTLGLMKLDMLSLGMLTAVQKSLQLLKAHKGLDWNLAQVPQEDKKTYDMICEADTVGVFQIESRAQMSLLPRLKPRNYYDLVIEVAIVRPGPIQGGMVHPYLKRRAGREKVTYAHPKLVPVLQKTLGIPLFQEQVMQIAIEVAGFTPGESDELRRVVSSAWKKKAVMDGLYQKVVNGMSANGIPREYADQIYKTIEGFSSYGFPESHAASFALITYISCYLKRHHPDVFACSLLNSQPMGFYSPRQIVGDAQRHGCEFRPLDVQHSVWDYTLEGKKKTVNVDMFKDQVDMFDVRVGFCSVYGLKKEAADTLIAERTMNGPFKSLEDLIRRTKLSKASMIRLAAADALRCFGLDAREAMWVIQGLNFDQNSLFFGAHSGLDEERQQIEIKLVPEEDGWQTVQREYQTKGFSIDKHPLGILRPRLKAAGHYTTAADLKSTRNRAKIRVAGLISLLQKPPTAKGMAFASIEDETGLMNVVITPDVYAQCRLILMGSPLLEVDGHLEVNQGVYNIKAAVIRPLMRAQSEPRRLTSTPTFTKNI